MKNPQRGSNRLSAVGGKVHGRPKGLLFWMAWRYLIAKKQGNGLSFMTAVSVIGVAVGVAALILVLSVMGGFEQSLKSRMLRGSPHLEIIAENALAGFPLTEHPLEQFESAYHDAVGVEPFVQADVVLKNGGHISSAVLYGVMPERGALWSFKDSMVEGELSSIGKMHKPLLTLDEEASEWPGIVLGDKLATQLSVDIGDEIAILNPQGLVSSSSTLSGATIARHYVLVGTFHTGLFNYDSKWAVVDLKEARKFLQDYDVSLDEEQYVSGVAINSHDPMHIEAFAARSTQFAGLKALTWKSSNASLILALQLEKVSMGSILMLIVLVAAFSISGTMMMSVFHKKRQICLLRAIGLPKADIVRLFLLQAHSIALVGIGIGTIVGLLGCLILFELQGLSIGGMKIFPVNFMPLDYVFIGISAWLLSILGAFYPAWTASRRDPSTGLRY